MRDERLLKLASACDRVRAAPSEAEALDWLRAEAVRFGMEVRVGSTPADVAALALDACRADAQPLDAVDAAMLHQLAAAATSAIRRLTVERQHRELDWLRQRFRETIEAFSDAFALFDPDDRLVDANGRFAELVGIDAASAGATFRDVADAVSRQLHPDMMPGGAEAWTEARVREHPTPPFELRYRDGRWTRVVERRTREGGIAQFRTDITALKQAKAELETALARTRLLLESISDAFLAIGRDGAVTYVNTAGERLFGRAGAELLGASLWSLLPAIAQPELADSIRRALDSGLPQNVVAQDAACAAWLEARTHPHAGGAVVYLIDVSDKIAADAELRRSRAELRTLMETVPAAIWLAHDPEARRITGSRFATELLRLPPQGNQSLTAPPAERPAHFRVLKDDRELLPCELPLQRAARGEFVRNEELRVVFDDGSYYDELLNAAPIFDLQGRPTGAVGTSTIITERKQAEERAYRLAHQDALTGLPNRLAFRRRLAKERERASRDGGHLGLLLVDIDHFKQVNDTLGHAVGDELLVEAARRLQQTVRKRDLVARLGGDEFAVLSGSADRPADFSGLAERLAQALRRPYRLHGNEVRRAVSIGLAVYPDDAADIDGLLANADFALYAAKEAGRDGWRVFDPSLREHARTCRELDHDLHRAVERREFELHYQPIVDLGSRTVREFEALLRWNDPVRGLVGPRDFLPFVERSRLLLAVTDWVLDAAVRQATCCAAEWGIRVPLAVNMPTLALDDEGLVERIASKLRTVRLDPAMLRLEVLEAALAGSHRIASLARLRAMGVRITVDDFGAGYSSLGQLKGLPIDQIKIDRRFLADRGGDARDRAILGGLLSLSAALGVEVVAEGVEQAEQLGLLQDLGCASFQGYLFARPMPAGQVAAWLDGWRCRTASLQQACGPLIPAPLLVAGTASSAP